MNIISIDIEATNRCNAVCHFCPRDATPHQGHMSMETFEQTLLRAVELREYNSAHSPSPVLVVPNICGLGEPLLNPNTPEFIRRIRAAGFDRCTMASNGSLLDKKRGAAVLDAGVTRVNINISDLGEDYEDIYNLPFETTRNNIIRFVEDSRGYCEVQIVLVNHHKDGEHIARMKAFWRDHGVDGFMVYEVMNRGGALFVEHMQYDQLPEFQQARELMRARGSDWMCPVPFVFLFVGYDGLYYLCCSDWKKEAPVASVYDASFISVTEQKLRHVLTREPVCKTCNHDPLNAAVDMIRDVKAGDKSQADLEHLIDIFSNQSTQIFSGVARAKDLVSQVHTIRLESKGSRLIPVVSV